MPVRNITKWVKIVNPVTHHKSTNDQKNHSKRIEIHANPLQKVHSFHSSCTKVRKIIKNKLKVTQISSRRLPTRLTCKEHNKAESETI